jgi:hypothetical protein
MFADADSLCRDAGGLRDLAAEVRYGYQVGGDVELQLLVSEVLYLPIHQLNCPPLHHDRPLR